MREDTVRAGVVGVGSMGSHHARVYQELRDVELVGVADADAETAHEVAGQYGTLALDRSELLATADVVSIAAPTHSHYDLASAAIDRGVHVLVEKPFVERPAAGRRLVEQASAAGVTLQVGHVERFNPAVETLAEVVEDLDLVAVEARRLGPPVGRNAGDGVVLDLMVHDIDVMLSLVDDEVQHVAAAGTHENQYVTANVGFENGVVGTLTASRLTQQKVRELSVTTEECQVNIDYLDQSVLIHRRSHPGYVEATESLRYRNESVIERPTVETGEPLKRELRAFVEAAVEGLRPTVTGEDGIRALELARTIDERATANAVEGDAR